MATFYLPASGGYATSNEYIKYRIAIVEGTLSGRTRPVTINVQFYRTNSYSTSRNGTVYCTINGTTYSATFDTSSTIGYNSYTTLFSKTVNVTYNGAGNASISVYAYWQTQTTSSGGTSYNSSNQGGSQALTAISAATYYLDLNGSLDGTDVSSLSPFGTADVYVNGTLQSNDCTDYYIAWAYGSTYEVKGITAKTGYTYTGNSSYSGTITGNTGIRLPFTTNSYTITYDANGGTGAPLATSYKYATSGTTNLSSTKPTRPNYNFLGWSLSADATEASYSAGQEWNLNNAANYTLYAVWELAYTKPAITNVSVFRSDAEGNASDEGVYLVAKFDWSTFLDVAEILIQWKTDSEADYLSAWSLPVSGTSGSVLTDPFGVTQNEDGSYNEISTDYTYDVRITVSDAGGSTPVEVSIPSLNFNFDMLPENKGASFGKAAEVENAVDFAFDILLRSGFNILVNYGESSQYNLLDRVGSKLDSYMQQISSLPTDTSDSFLFTCTAGVTCGSITIPQYAKGILICSYASSYDAVVIAVDANLNLYLGFRNYTTWSGRKI
ncbi:MAG: InlB B-repeat-containing protein [Eubacterium sp.]|nr:InlB B-repeat-containing protein [Eubacterium sp.]